MRPLVTSKSITKRESVSLDKYLNEIGKVRLITPEREVELAKKIKAGDEEALRELTEANLRFVVSTAKHYQNKGLPLQDLINEGNLGLIKAAKLFDETKGFKFISYAVRRIRQSITEALAEHSRLVRIPLNRVGSLNITKKTKDMLEQELHREATPGEIAEILGETEEYILQELVNDLRPTSLDAPIDEREDITLLDIFIDPHEESLDHHLNHTQSLKKELIGVLNILSPLESEIITLYYGIGREYPLSFITIGERFKLKPARVRQIRDTAMSKLKRKIKTNHLKKYLGQ